MQCTGFLKDLGWWKSCQKMERRGWEKLVSLSCVTPLVASDQGLDAFYSYLGMPDDSRLLSILNLQVVLCLPSWTLCESAAAARSDGL